MLEDQGHGNHRDEEVKIAALEWVLELDRRKGEQRRVELQGLGFGGGVEELGREEKMGSQLLSEKKEKEKNTEITTERTFSMASIKVGQVQVHYGSSTSL